MEKQLGLLEDDENRFPMLICYFDLNSHLQISNFNYAVC